MTAAAGRLRMTNPRSNHALFVRQVALADSGQSPGSTLILTVTGSSIAAGHSLIFRSAADYTATAPTISDTPGNTYATARTAASSGNTMRASIAYCQVASVLNPGDVITLTWPSSLVNKAVVVDEFSALLSPITVDATNGATGVSSTPDAQLTTTYPVDLVVSALASVAPLTDSYTQDAGWTGLGRAGTSPGSAPYISVGGAYRLAKSTNTWHYKPVLGNSTTWVGLSASFKAT